MQEWWPACQNGYALSWKTPQKGTRRASQSPGACVCACVCVCVCVCTCAHVHGHAHMHTCTHVYMRVLNICV